MGDVELGKAHVEGTTKAPFSARGEPAGRGANPVKTLEGWPSSQEWKPVRNYKFFPRDI